MRPWIVSVCASPVFDRPWYIFDSSSCFLNIFWSDQFVTFFIIGTVPFISQFILFSFPYHQKYHRPYRYQHWIKNLLRHHYYVTKKSWWRHYDVIFDDFPVLLLSKTCKSTDAEHFSFTKNSNKTHFLIGLYWFSSAARTWIKWTSTVALWTHDQLQIT